MLHTSAILLTILLTAVTRAGAMESSPGDTPASSLPDPYFAFEESWALARAPENGHYPITTFIPRSFLLFNVDRLKTRKISGHEYLEATTQDDVDVLIRESTVSKRTFRKAIGRHQIVFNSRSRVCRSVGCNIKIDEEVWTIHAGDAFETVDSPYENQTRLRGDRSGNVIEGFVADAELSRWVQAGIVTRSDVKHPKYEVTRVEAPTLTTLCGELRTRGAKLYGAISDADHKVLEAFEIGILDSTPDGPTVTVSKDYGRANGKFVYRVYHFVARTGAEFDFIAQINYVCDVAAPVESLIRIDRVDLRRVDKNQTEAEMLEGVERTVTLLLFSTPKKLHNYTRGAYLYSVNSYEQYVDLMGRLGRLFGDRSLAGYFLSEFNRSCYSGDRRTAVCSGHSYRAGETGTEAVEPE